MTAINFIRNFIMTMVAVFFVRFDYDKAKAHPVGFGYDLRPDTPLTGIVLHSTEGKIGSSFASECIYIRDVRDKSAHYYIGKDGAIQRILDPGKFRAWHAGVSAWLGRQNCNDFMVGIEMHHADGEEYTEAQLEALAWLCELLMKDHPTITTAGIALHRWVALPAGRKIDPSVDVVSGDNFTVDDAFWQAWIAALAADPFDDYRYIAGPSTISREVLAQALAGSPALNGVSADVYYDAAVQAGINPAFVLAIFCHESQRGTDGIAKTTNSWGNNRRGRGHESGYVKGPFAKFNSFLDGLLDVLVICKEPEYQGSISAFFQRYAPSSDGNAPVSYAGDVLSRMHGWARLSGKE